MSQVMTDADRIVELDRQLNNIEAGTADTVLCPWCGVMSPSTGPDCCDTFTFSRDERGKRQLNEVIRQHKLVLGGLATCISCPWCKGVNYPFDPNQHPSEWKREMISPFCCETFQGAMMAIVQRMVSDELIARKKRIEDGIVQAGKN